VIDLGANLVMSLLLRLLRPSLPPNFPPVALGLAVEEDFSVSLFIDRLLCSSSSERMLAAAATSYPYFPPIAVGASLGEVVCS